MTTGKTIALTRRTFVSKVMSLLFNMLSRFVIAIFPRSKHLLISWLQSVTVSTFSLFGEKQMLFPHPLPGNEVIGLDARITPSHFAIKVVSSAYTMLLIFLPTILLPACESSSPAFHMM